MESKEAGFRALRCGHSLLGGEWLPRPGRHQKLEELQEPIFTIFILLEAVRLVEVAGHEPSNASAQAGDPPKQALVV